MPGSPVTQGAASSSLPSSSFTGAASDISTISASIASCFTDTLNAGSDLNAWLEALAAEICSNSTDISTNATDIDALEAADVSILASIAAIESDITALEAADVVLAADIATNAADIATNASDISGLTSDLAALDVRVDALEAPGGIADGPTLGGIPYWGGSAWGGSTSAPYIDTSDFGLRLAAPASPDAVLDIKALAAYTDILAITDTTDAAVFEIPRASAVVRVTNRDIRIQETSTAAKGLVFKDRTLGTYQRLYVANGSVALESA